MVLTLLFACRAVKETGDTLADTALESTSFPDSSGDTASDSTPPPDSTESTAPQVDADSDGHADGADCDDSDASRHPDADERCDQVDNDCDGENTLCSDSMADITIRTTRDVDYFGFPEAAGDVDGDGRDDLLITDGGNYCCYPFAAPATVLLRTQDLVSGDNEEETSRWTYAFADTLYPVGDVDGDGRGDLAVLGERDETLGVGLVTDITTIAGAVDAGVVSNWWSAGWAVGEYGPAAMGWSTADLDGDGVAEFDLAGPDGATYLISTGVFRADGELLDDAVVVDIGGYSKTSLGDLDGDGLADLTLASVGQGAWFYTGAALAPGSIYTTADADRMYAGSAGDEFVIEAGALPDLDGDGLGELGVVASCKSWVLSPVSAATLDDAFATLTTSADHCYLELGHAGDQDGDGAADLLVVGYDSDGAEDGALGLWSGPDVRGALTFEEGAGFWLWSDASGFYRYSLPSTTGDVNGDGQLDLIFGNSGEKEAYVMYGPLVE